MQLAGPPWEELLQETVGYDVERAESAHRIPFDSFHIHWSTVVWGRQSAGKHLDETRIGRAADPTVQERMNLSGYCPHRLIIPPRLCPRLASGVQQEIRSSGPQSTDRANRFGTLLQPNMQVWYRGSRNRPPLKTHCHFFIQSKDGSGPPASPNLQ